MSDADRAASLRRLFDESFAHAPGVRAEAAERILRLRIGGDGFAFRLAEVAGFSAARKIVPLPSAVPGALGLTGVRGALVPVYSLAVLLGRAADEEAPRWFVLASAPEPVALAFARFDGYAEVARDELHALGGAATDRHVTRVVRVEARHWGVVSIPSLMESIAASVIGTPKER